MWPCAATYENLRWAYFLPRLQPSSNHPWSAHLLPQTSLLTLHDGPAIEVRIVCCQRVQSSSRMAARSLECGGWRSGHSSVMLNGGKEAPRAQHPDQRIRPRAARKSCCRSANPRGWGAGILQAQSATGKCCANAMHAMNCKSSVQ